MDALRKAEIELDKEMHKQVDLIYSASAIAFSRHWGWGALKIRRLFDDTAATFDECGGSNDVSMLQMLENETGIELKIPNTDKSYSELAFMNTAIKMDPRKMTRAQWIYMRQRQKTWIGAMVLGCLFLALHRKYNFGYKRLVRLMGQIDEIKEEYNYNRKALVQACREVARVELEEALK